MEQALYASSTLQQAQLHRPGAVGGAAPSTAPAGAGAPGERGAGQQPQQQQLGEASSGGVSSSGSAGNAEGYVCSSAEGCVCSSAGGLCTFMCTHRLTWGLCSFMCCVSQRRYNHGPNTMTHADAPPAAKQPTSLSALKKAGFSTFLTNVVTKVVDAGADVADNINTKLLGQLGGATREPPPLDAVFAKTTAWPDAPSVPVATTAAASAAGADRRALLGEEGPSGSTEHRLAQAGRAVGPDGKPKARTAEEIRAAYGAKQKRCG